MRQSPRDKTASRHSRRKALKESVSAHIRGEFRVTHSRRDHLNDKWRAGTDQASRRLTHRQKLNQIASHREIRTYENKLIRAELEEQRYMFRRGLACPFVW
jgi:hypothetical protein